jgi:hypothetical protein
MAIEKPAAIFSEAGLKIFLEALLSIKSEADIVGMVENITHGSGGHNGNNGHDDEVEALVTEYKGFKKKDKEQRMEQVTEYISEFMADGKVKGHEEIYNYLLKLGFEYGTRSIGPVMRGICKRNPAIERIGKNQYRLKGFDV